MTCFKQGALLIPPFQRVTAADDRRLFTWSVTHGLKMERRVQVSSCYKVQYIFTISALMIMTYYKSL